MNGFQNLWTRLTTPFANDPDEALCEYMTRVILLMQGIALTVFTIPIVVGWIAGAFPLEAVIIMLSLLVPTIAGFWWAYHGRWQIARHIPPIPFFALGLYLSSINPLGMTSLLFFILAVMLTSMLQGVRAYWFVLVLSMVAYFAIGVGRSQESIQIIIETIIIVGGTLTGIALLQRFSISQFQRAILKAHKRREELDDANQKLHAEIAERERAEQELRESEAHYRLLAENMTDIVWTMDMNLRFTYLSPSVTSLGGYSVEEAMALSLEDILTPASFEIAVKTFTEELVAEKTRQGGAFWPRMTELEQLCKDGSAIWTEVTTTFLRDPYGRPVGIMGVTRDITERKQAEEGLREHRDHLEELVTARTAELDARVAEVEQLNRGMINLLDDLQAATRTATRTAQRLEVTNDELEAFVYSVSHDLRAPLRHADRFAQLLLQREAARLEPTSARYLQNIIQAAGKMERLIDDLLALSRTSQTEMKLRRVAPNEIVEQVRQELEPEIKGRRITWEIPPLPAVRADPGLLRVVWTNLLSNAVKYTAPRPQARIEIGATPPDGEGQVTFFIRDDGVGFDPQYAHKLFGVFQRLHRDEEFEGSGIGLATVRRIIHRHGGRVWAEGEVDRGATFYFTLRG